MYQLIGIIDCTIVSEVRREAPKFKMLVSRFPNLPKLLLYFRVSNMVLNKKREERIFFFIVLLLLIEPVDPAPLSVLTGTTNYSRVKIERITKKIKYQLATLNMMERIKMRSSIF